VIVAQRAAARKLFSLKQNSHALFCHAGFAFKCCAFRARGAQRLRVCGENDQRAVGAPRLFEKSTQPAYQV